MESRIPPLQDGALIVVQRQGIHVPNMFKMKACLYTGGYLRKNIAKKLIK